MAPRRQGRKLESVDNTADLVDNNQPMQPSPTPFARRLRQARVAQQLTLDDLADRLGGIVTKAALSKYERGESRPRPSVLRALSRTLGLPAGHFIGEEADDGPIEWVAYRKHSRLGVHKREYLESIAEQRASAQLHLVRLLHPAFEPDVPSQRAVSTLDDAENAAIEVRAEWNLGDNPIEHLVQLVEDKGAIVVESPEEDGFDALSGRTRSGVPIIVLNTSRSADRIRFNVAHELGHLLLACPGAEPKEEEALAHRFAAAMIVPATAARRELGERRTNLASSELECLKQKYGLSVAAWTRRARDLSIISDSIYRSWQIRLRSHGEHVRESTDYVGDERPVRMRVLCTQAIAERLVDSAWMHAHCQGLAPLAPADPSGSRSIVRALRAMDPEQRRPLLEALAQQVSPNYSEDPEVREWLEIDDDSTDAPGTIL